MQKLWENANPTSAFAGQRVSVSITDYDLIMVCAKWFYSATTIKSIIIPTGDNLEIEFAIPRTDGALVARRYATAGNNSITFSDGVSATGNTASTTNNDVCIPVKIYGIKL